MNSLSDPEEFDEAKVREEIGWMIEHALALTGQLPEGSPSREFLRYLLAMALVESTERVAEPGKGVSVKS